MSTAKAFESLVIAKTGSGVEFRASILRLLRNSVAFEVYDLSGALRLSELLKDFKIVLNGKAVYSGRAVISSLVGTDALTFCEVSIEDSWLDMDFLDPFGNNVSLRDQFQAFVREWEKNYRILSLYKQAVADLQTFLIDMRRWIGQVDIGLRGSSGANRRKPDGEVAGELVLSTTPALTTLFEKFEEAAASVPTELLPTHRHFARQQLHPLLMCSPFLHRTFHKPLGYSGDYEMVNMIFRTPFEGPSLFAKLLNAWFLDQPPAEAHRNRIQHLIQRISEITITARQIGNRARILSLGCGSAWEVQKFMAQDRFADSARFTLLDFNSETIEHAKEALEKVRQQHGRTTEIELAKKSVAQIVKEGRLTIGKSENSRFDLIYCAGLFDYLSDGLCRRLSDIFYDWLAPGGVLITTNVDKYNPRRLTMEHVMEWHLTYRSRQELAALKPNQASTEGCSVMSDSTGANLYFEAIKPRCE